ncbi:MAG: sugar transferase [Dorea sp.]|nr:sugar transferase [Dorea sp.]
MKWREWEELPKGMQKPEVREYYEILSKKRLSLKVKRVFDVTAAEVLLVMFGPVLAVLAVLIKLDSKGPVFYRQERVTAYGKKFRIHKLRTMVADADRIGAAVTVGGDSRITKVGAFLRRYRLDEVPQLIDVLKGDMSFVGTRPEVAKYVRKYTNEMRATLLLPAGITSEASIRYKDEAELLDGAEDVDRVYVEKVLPGKMEWNLKSIRDFSVVEEIILMFQTVFAVFRKEQK